MIVLTVDQQGSRRRGDRVDSLLAELAPRAPGFVRPFERTVGDEVQAVVADGDLAVATALHLLRLRGWSVGVGVGDVDEPLPPSARAGSGAAFVHARDAVEQAKGRGRAVPLAVRGADADRAGEAEAVLALLGVTVLRRSPAGWAAVDAVRADPGAPQSEVAARLGITQQALSQRLRAAGWREEDAARPLAARLVTAAGTR